jgi:hypothetical protein
MGEKSSQITREIENTRAQLGSNLAELERKVKGYTDWRQRFEKNPLKIMALAFGGGLFLAIAFKGRHASRRSYDEDDYLGNAACRDVHMRKMTGRRPLATMT